MLLYIWPHDPTNHKFIYFFLLLFLLIFISHYKIWFIFQSYAIRRQHRKGHFFLFLSSFSIDKIILCVAFFYFPFPSSVQVLITKLRSANTLETRQYRKASKALLVLIPLLGITYLVVMAGPNEGVGSYIFAVARALLLSTQVWFWWSIMSNIYVQFFLLFSLRKKKCLLRLVPKAVQ